MVTKDDIDKYLNENDYYKLFNLEKDAKATDIEKSYRKLSVKWHPDKVKVKDEKLLEDAHKVFKKLSEAKEVLTDTHKREIYDKYGLKGLQEQGPEVSPEQEQELMKEFMKQMFNDQFTKVANVPDINFVEELTLEELYTGKDYKKKIERFNSCKECNGMGTEDGNEHNCKDCGGTGVEIKIRQMGNMIQQMQQICTKCHGSGADIRVGKCVKCNGKKLVKEQAEINIKIPKGAYHGIVIGIRNEGNEIPPQDRNNANINQTRSNVHVKVKEKKHEFYERNFTIKNHQEISHPKDLKINLKISLVESLTGFTRDIKLINGKQTTIVHDKIVKHGDVLVIPNMGMPVIDNGLVMGHLYIVFEVEYPEDLKPNIKRRLWQLLMDTPYKEPSSVKNKITLESTDKYKYDAFKEKTTPRPFPFPNAFHIPGMPPGFTAQFAGPKPNKKFEKDFGNYDDSDNENDNEEEMFGKFDGDDEMPQGQQCKVQ
jgi:DnaJ-class molecular chaperone